MRITSYVKRVAFQICSAGYAAAGKKQLVLFTIKFNIIEQCIYTHEEKVHVMCNEINMNNVLDSILTLFCHHKFIYLFIASLP